MPITVTRHAIERYQERVEPVSDDEAVARLSCPAIEKAAAFGARYVVLGCGNRAVIVDGHVVTVLAKGDCLAAHYKDRKGRT